MHTHEHDHGPTSDEAALSAVRWNASMAAGQVVAGLATGNLGFLNEAAHNSLDVVSFDAKRRAMKNTSRRSRNLRRGAAIILTCGGFAAIGGGYHQAKTGENENASLPAVAIAFAGALANSYIAMRTHKAQHPQDEDHGHKTGAYEDLDLHTVTDSITGWIYVGGLLAENKIPGAANYAVMANGFVTASAGGFTIRNIIQTDKPPTGSA